MKLVRCFVLFVFTALLFTILMSSAALAFDTSGWYWPVPDSLNLSQGFHSGHKAIDVQTFRGINEKIVAASAGTVIAVFDGCENWDGYYDGHENCHPVAYLLYSEDVYGNREPQYNTNFETGEQFTNYVCNCGIGRGVIIDHGNGVYSEYAHMASVCVSVGQQVYGGTELGTMGSYGNSTGRHLHFSIREGAWMDGIYIKGTPVNTNPIGSDFAISGSWNGVRNIPYSLAYRPYTVSFGTFDGYLVLQNPWRQLRVNESNDNVELVQDNIEYLLAQSCWHFEEQNDGSYIITSLYNGKVLSLAGGSSESATNVLVETANGTDAQRWYFYSDTSTGSKINTNLRLDVEGEDYTNLRNIWHWNAYGGQNQKIWPYKLTNDTDKPFPSGFSLQSSITIPINSQASLTHSFSPVNCEPKYCDLTWSSSDPSIATVNQNGVVTALKPGKVYITAKPAFNDRWARTCTVYVDSLLPVPEILDVSVVDHDIRVRWTETPSTGANDTRAYEVYVYERENLVTPVASQRTNADWAQFTLNERGMYRATVVSVNTFNGYKSLESSFSDNFIILDSEWAYIDALRIGGPTLYADYDLKFLQTFSGYVTSVESPGAGWARSAKSYIRQDGQLVKGYIWLKDASLVDMYNINAKIIINCYRLKSFDNKLVLPEGLTRIEAEAFMDDAEIEELIVPESCTYIGPRAFAGCTSLKRARIPLATVIAEDAFDGCEYVRFIRPWGDNSSGSGSGSAVVVGNVLS